MPELPEVETVRKGLEKLVKSFEIGRIEVLKERSIASIGGSKEFISQLVGNRFHSWERRGKYLIANLRKKESIHSGCLVVHLRMTGQFQLLKDDIDPNPTDPNE